MEDDPFAVIEAMTIAGLRHRLRARLPLHPRRVPARDASGSSTPSPRRAPARLPRRRRHGPRLALRHRAAPRRRRLHLRRGDGALQLDRGLPRRAAQQAAVPGRGRACSASRPSSTTSRRSSTSSTSSSTAGAAYAGHRHRGLDRARAVLRLGLRGAAGRVRGAVRHHAAASCIDAGRRRRRRPTAAGGPARRRGGRVRRPGRARPAAHLRGHPRRPAPRSARASSWSSTRPSTLVPMLLRIAAFFRDESCGQCVPCRVGTVRQEEALHAAGRTAPARLASTTSSPCSTSSAAACATRRSAAWARRRRAPSSRPSGRFGPSRRRGPHERRPGHRCRRVGRARDRRRGGARPARARRSSTPAGRRRSTPRRSASPRRSRR